jgi:hypothetical protein
VPPGPRIFLVTYHPLVSRRAGREAIAADADLPPFIDSSCRREPDFQSQWPSITALCRGKLFAPRLELDDVVVYLARKGHYADPDGHARCHRLTAVLRVWKRFETHAEAARWYGDRGKKPPSNCMVPGNRPVPISQTGRTWKSLDQWDAAYAERAARCGVFLVCRAEFLELRDPPVLREDALASVFRQRGGMPATLNPPAITPVEYARLLRAAGVRSK